jgi:AcrR family transcriptional regulator
VFVVARADSRKATETSAKGMPGSDATRDKLIEAAGRVFADRGFHAATVREICRRAGANVAAINYHFGDKLGLYTAVLQESVKASKLQAMQTALDDLDAPAEETLRAVIRARLESAARSGLPDWQVGIMAHEFARPTPALTHLVETVSKPMFVRVLDLIGRILELPAEHPTTHLCGYSILGQILFYVMSSPLAALLWPDGRLTPESVGRIADHIADFSLAYLREAKAHHRRDAALRAPRT